jgi:hypothetical protein
MEIAEVLTSGSGPLFLALVWTGAWNEPTADAFSKRQ